MPNLPYMPDSHLIDAISVRASGHHHLGLCVPMTRPFIVDPALNSNNATSMH